MLAGNDDGIKEMDLAYNLQMLLSQFKRMRRNRRSSGPPKSTNLIEKRNSPDKMKVEDMDVGDQNRDPNMSPICTDVKIVDTLGPNTRPVRRGDSFVKRRDRSILENGKPKVTPRSNDLGPRPRRSKTMTLLGHKLLTQNRSESQNNDSKIS